MLSTIIQNKYVTVEIGNKLSISDVRNLLKVTINGVNYTVSTNDFIFNSVGIENDNPTIFKGQFELLNGMVFSVEDSIKLQKMYLQWETETLSKSSIVYKIPKGRNDTSAGIPIYNPYFIAMYSRMCRQYGFDLESFGGFSSVKEKIFAYQYAAFHPSMIEFAIGRLKDSSMPDRVVIKDFMFELMIKNACAHIEGYRDHLRFENLSKSNKLEYVKDDLYFVEYEHILDADLSTEYIDFQERVGCGGFLDVLNMPT